MSYDFNASQRYIDGTFTSQYDSEGITLAIWMKLAAAEWGNTAQKVMLKFGEGLSEGNQLLMLTHTDSAADRVTATSRSTSNGNANNTLQVDHDDIWQLFIGTFESDTVRRSLAQDSSDQASNTSSDKAVGTALDSIRLGAGTTGSSNVDGLMAEAAIWDKALSNAEKDTIWISEGKGNAFDGIAASNLIGYWPLLVDQSTHANLGTDASGTLTVNNAVFSSDHPIIVATDSGPEILVPMGPLR